MKERPILFSSAMIRALLSGQKTQTRRVCKNQDAAMEILRLEAAYIESLHHIGPGEGAPILLIKKADELLRGNPCLQGVKGDHLWCRETFHHGDAWYPETIGMEWKNVRREDGMRTWLTWVDYAATFTELDRDFPWTPSVFMPRWASRITLEITSVNIERLQDISEEDAIAEGIEQVERSYGKAWRDYSGHCGACFSDPKTSYLSLWDSINGKKYPWASNPAVWVVAFKRL